MSVGPDFLYELKGIPKPGAVKKIGSSTKTTKKKKTKKAKDVTPDLGSLTDSEKETPTRDYQQEYYDQLRREERRSAYDLLKDTFESYGLNELVPDVERFFQQGLAPREATLALRETAAYQERFRGNEGRRALGLAAFTEGEYLSAENVYSELLRSTGLESIANRKTFASLIGGAVSVAEAQDRIENVFSRIDNAGEDLKQQLGQYFSQYGVSDPAKQRADIAAAILGGPETAQTLQRQLQKAELRAGAARARFEVTEQRVEQLQKQLESAGVSDVYSTAKAGFSTLSETQPLTETLAERYKVGTEGLVQELEQEAFFGLQSQRRKKLQEQEKATFAGQSGTTQVSLASRGTAGQI